MTADVVAQAVETLAQYAVVAYGIRNSRQAWAHYLDRRIAAERPPAEQILDLARANGIDLAALNERTLHT